MTTMAGRMRLLTLGFALAAAAASLSAQPTVTLRVEPSSVGAGQVATVVVTAPAGTPVTLTTDAPGVPPRTIVATGGEQRIPLGPFPSTGDYRVTASGGVQPVTAPVRVTAASEPAPASPPSQSYQSSASALLDALNGARTGLSRLPAIDPTIGETKAAIDALQQQLNDIRRAATETDSVFDAVREQLGKDEAIDREGKDQFTRLERELHQNLEEQARQVREFGRDAEQPAADSCAAAMAVSAALQAQRSTMNAMRGGVRELAQQTAGHGQRSSPTNAAAWRAIKAKIEDLVQTGQSGSYADAERSIGHATSSNGLGGYAERQCDKYTGTWTGTTSVEALHKGQAYYGLQNDWSARAEIAVARVPQGAETADRPLRGTLTGRATNFKIVNELRTLYAGLPASSIRFLTTDPSSAQQESATFVAAIEGFVRGNQMTLKIRPGGVDYSGRLTGKLTSIVIPMASPIPLVQIYDVMFQGGNWQLSRAIGPNGTADRPFPITVGGDKRLVQAHYPRSLSSAGARGHFTIDVRLCSGCE